MGVLREAADAEMRLSGVCMLHVHALEHQHGAPFNKVLVGATPWAPTQSRGCKAGIINSAVSST